MDRRSWPWKKKEKATAPTDSNAGLVNSTATQAEEENLKTVKCVQISEESYARLTELEDQVKILNEKLNATVAENSSKDTLVKQHAKVAEEAVSGWEKAEAESIALKSQLESVTLMKLTAEDRASHLDGALKECMRQVRNVKEESEQKLHDVVFAKTKQWAKLQAEMEAKIEGLDHDLLKASAENTALSRSLQEKSNIIVKISEEKARADAEIEVLKSNIRSCEREINSLKYELQVVSKELEIRNEEKNMNLRQAEIANKQHLEGVKKIAKLEAECQRLRGLVRKKLPGPAALAQMKQEVDSLGRDYMEPTFHPSPSKLSSPRPNYPPELENVPHILKENEFITARLIEMEEESKLLKEALSRRNYELEASRNVCAETATKLQIMETRLQAVNQQKSLASMSDNRIEDATGVSEAWTTTSISEFPLIKQEKDGAKSIKTEKPKNLEFMDDFLEMEKLACLSPQSIADDCRTFKALEKEEQSSDEVKNGAPKASSSEESSSVRSRKEHSTLRSLQSRILSIFESNKKEFDISKVLDDIKVVVQDIQEGFSPQLISRSSDENMENGLSLNYHSKIDGMDDQTRSQALADAILHIHDFVKSKVMELRRDEGELDAELSLTGKIKEFLVSLDHDALKKIDVGAFVIDLSHVLECMSKLGFRIQSGKNNEGEINSPACIDKLTLLENTVSRHDSNEKGYDCSDEEFEILKREKDNMLSDLTRCKKDLEQKELQLDEKGKKYLEIKAQLASSEKSNSLAETQLKCMAESYKSLETRAAELETELNHLRARAENLEIELREEKRSHKDASAKCEELETKCRNLEAQVKDLEATCQENEIKCKNNLKQNNRTENESVCSPSKVESDKAKQEREIAAAAEKLAECQETILLLGKQLTALRSPADSRDLRQRDKTQIDVSSQGNEANINVSNSVVAGSQDLDHEEMERNSGCTHRYGSESPLNVCHAPKSPSNMIGSPLLRSPVNLKHQKNSDRALSSPSGAITPEKQGRGFSRFFSKGKGSH